jgi:hypothetical protein
MRESWVGDCTWSTFSSRESKRVYRHEYGPRGKCLQTWGAIRLWNFTTRAGCLPYHDDGLKAVDAECDCIASVPRIDRTGEALVDRDVVRMLCGTRGQKCCDELYGECRRYAGEKIVDDATPSLPPASSCAEKLGPCPQTPE